MQLIFLGTDAFQDAAGCLGGREQLRHAESWKKTACVQSLFA
jgi:hypothetical protein